MKTQKYVDAELVTQFQSGNANALAELVKRWHKKFCEKAFWILRDADQSKDIAQDSWRTIMRKIHDLKNPSSFGGWALRIVCTKALDAIREKNRIRILQENLAKEQPYETEPESNYLKVELLRAIKELSVNHQMVIKLFYVEDYSLNQISNLLKISVGTAKSRLFHSREKLKSILKEIERKY